MTCFKAVCSYFPVRSEENNEEHSVCSVYVPTFVVGHLPSSHSYVSNSTARQVFIEFLNMQTKTPCL